MHTFPTNVGRVYRRIHNIKNGVKEFAWPIKILICQVLRFGGYHKRRSLCLRSTRPIIWSLQYSPDGLGGLCTPWGRHIPIDKKARQWKTLNPQPSIVAQCSFETLVELGWSDCGMSLEHNALFSRWTWRIIRQTMMEAHLVKRPDHANDSRLAPPWLHHACSKHRSSCNLHYILEL